MRFSALFPCLPPSVFLAACLAGCGMFGDDRLAGSEVTNPPQKLAGYIRSADGDAAPGVPVVAYPAGFNPVEDASAAALPLRMDTTDAQGAYAIRFLDSGETYNLWAVDPSRGTRVLIREVRPDTVAASKAPDGFLEKPGALSILIHDSLPDGKAHVYLAGTPLSRDLQSLGSEPGFVLLDSVAAGRIPRLFHKVDGPAGARTLLAENLLVRPGDTLPVGVYAAWKESKRIFLNTTAAGAAVSGDAGPIPLLIRLDSAGFDFSAAREDGSDIRFATKAGLPLPFEIETWNRAEKSAAIWVRVPVVRGNDFGQCIRIYWGNPAAESESQSRAVFDTSFHFAGVWHLNALGAGSPPVLEDASTAGNSAHAGEYPAGLALTPTPFGVGMRQNGLRSALSTDLAFNNPGAITVSIWFRTVTDSGGLLLGFNGWQPDADSTLERDRHIWMDDSGFVHFGIAVSTADPSVVERHFLSGPAPLNDGEWHFAAGTLSESGMAFYIDGKRVGMNAAVVRAQAYTGYWRMGFSYRMTDWAHPFSAKYFKGDLDEGRAALRAYPEDWLKLSFGNQSPQGKLIRFDPD